MQCARARVLRAGYSAAQRKPGMPLYLLTLLHAMHDAIARIKHLFSTADGDQSGSLDEEEFQQFYPILQDYWLMNNDYALPPAAQCMADMDDANLCEGVWTRSVQQTEYVYVCSMRTAW